MLFRTPLGSALERAYHQCYLADITLSGAKAFRDGKELAEHLGFLVPWDWPYVKAWGKTATFLPYEAHLRPDDDKPVRLHIDDPDAIWTQDRLWNALVAAFGEKALD